MPRIPLLDLKAQYENLKPHIDAAATRVLESGNYILGPEVTEFESEFADYCGARHAIGVDSGTSALHLALLACGVRSGDEVITVPFTFVATVAAVLYTGARPVLVDVEPHTLTMDIELLDAAISPRTKAIVPVHLYGQPADMAPILEIGARYRIPVIEDAAQAHGARYGGRGVGTMGISGCFSFYPGKNLGAVGDGGALTTDDDVVAHRLRMLRDWGSETKYRHQLRGYNSRLDELQAAILRVKLEALEEWTEARRNHAHHYRQSLDQVGVEVVGERRGDRHVYHILAIRTDQRAELIAALAAEGVATGIHYPVPVHLQEAYREIAGGPGSFPVAERAANEVLSLPIYPELTTEQRNHIVELVAGIRTKTAAA